MKKIISIITILTLGLVLVACGGDKATDKHQQVFDQIQIGYQPGDSSISITQNINLPKESSVAGATLNWISTDPATITTDGLVTRPSSENKTVIMILELTIDGVKREKNFYLTVLKAGDSGGGNGDETYTVSFNSDGGSDVSPQTVSSGGKITPPSNVTKAGFSLDGWYKDTNKENKWDFSSDVVTSNITLYAKWVIGDSGVPSGYTPISTKEGFLGITDLNGKYILTADIDFGGGEVTPLGGWGELYPFSGTFDGNGYALMNFKITGSNHEKLLDPNGDSFGASLFPTLTGIVRNLNIINATIVGDGFSGGVAGLNEGDIQNVYFQGTVTASKSWGSGFEWAVPAGGIAGIQGGSGVVSNVFIDAKVTGGHIFFGYAFNNASNLLAVKETLLPEMDLETGQEKEGETDYLVKSFINSQVITKPNLPNVSNFGIKWSITGATRPFLTRVDGQVPSWALR